MCGEVEVKSLKTTGDFSAECPMLFHRSARGGISPSPGGGLQLTGVDREHVDAVQSLAGVATGCFERSCFSVFTGIAVRVEPLFPAPRLASESLIYFTEVISVRAALHSPLHALSLMKNAAQGSFILGCFEQIPCVCVCVCAFVLVLVLVLEGFKVGPCQTPHPPLPGLYFPGSAESRDVCRGSA